MTDSHIWVVETTPKKKREWQRTLPGLNGYLWGHCLFLPYCRAICSHEDAASPSPSSHSSRFWWLLADTVWLISFHDLINHSISSQRRINIVLKWAISTKSRALTTTQHTLAGARRLARTDARVLDRYAEELVISPRLLSDDLFCGRNPSAKRLQRDQKRVIKKKIYIFAREEISAQFHSCIFSFHGSAGIIKASFFFLWLHFHITLISKGRAINTIAISILVIVSETAITFRACKSLLASYLFIGHMEAERSCFRDGCDE